MGRPAAIVSVPTSQTTIILAIDAKRAIEDGIVIGRAGRTVFLTLEIPAEYLRKAEEPEVIEETEEILPENQ